VLALGSRRWRSAAAIVVASALVVHGAAAGRGYQLSDLLQIRAFSALVMHSVHERVRSILEIEVETPPKPPEPEPVKEPEPEPEPAKAPPPPPPAAKAPTPEPPKAEPPPPAAEAGKVLTAEPDPNEPLDLTGDVGFVSGNGERYVGGVTASSGKGQKPVYERGASAKGVENGKGSAPVAATPSHQGPDLSRPPRQPSTSRLEHCPWPAEADVEQINSMRVPVVVFFDASGKIVSAKVTKDPGAGFGREAQRCIMREPPWTPSLNAEGKPVPGSILLTINYRR
jgi:protein TonB